MTRTEMMTQADSLVKELNVIRERIQRLHESLRLLTSQKSENDAVRVEFDKLESSAKIWKLTGPLLILQDSDDARVNVEKRIDFISKELETLEKNIKSSEADFDKKRQELMNIQSQIQSMTQE